MLALCRTGAVHTTQEISPLGRFEKNPTWLEMICMPEQYRVDLFGRVGGQKLSYNSPSGTKLRTPKLPVGKLCRDIYVHMVPFGNWLSLLKFDWRLLTKNDESRANRLTRASLLTRFFGARPSLLLQKETRVRARSSRQKHPRHSRDAFEVQSSTPLGVQPCVLTKTTMSNALAAPTALGATPSTVRSDTSDLF